MGIFNIFGKKKIKEDTTTSNGVLGPTYLDDFAAHIQNPHKLYPFEWRRKIQTSSGNGQFKIKYFGKRHDGYNNLIVGTEVAPSLVYAIDVLTNEVILLFDGGRHGYNAMFCDAYTEEQLKGRLAETIYIDKDGHDTFEITISTYNQFDYDGEFEEEELSEGDVIELVNGDTMPIDEVKRNGFDFIQIMVKNSEGKTTEIISDELA